jgi:F-type H+-transporting ATPase subunit epsilon
MATMHVELVSIEKAIWSGEATAVFGRTTDGDLGILPGHTPLLGALDSDHPVRIDREDGDSITVEVQGGFLFVHKDNRVSVLAEQAELTSGEQA